MKKSIPNFYSIEELKREYQRTSQGFWFNEDSMLFFKTRLTSHFETLKPNLYLFITTEKGPSGIRLASIRVAKIKRDSKMFCGYKIEIKTFGEFNSMSLTQASRKIKSISAKDLIGKLNI